MGKPTATTDDDAMEIFKKQKWEQFLSLTSSLLLEDEAETMKKFWSIEVKRRKTGNTEGSFDAYYSFSSNDDDDDGGEKKKKKKKFRSLKEVERYMREEERGAKKTTTTKTTTTTTTTLPMVTTTKKKETPPTEQIRERKTAGVTTTTTTTGKSGGGVVGGGGSRFVKNETAFKNAMDDEEENDDDDEDDEPVLPSALGFGTGRAAKVFANNASALRQQSQRQHQRRQSAFLPSRSHLHNSTSNNSNGAKTHSRLHNSFVANSPRLAATTTAVVNHDDDANDDDDNRRRRRSATTTTKRNENGKKREETRGQDWRLSNPSDELFDKKRDAFLNKDPEVALERRMLKERFSDKNNSDINNDKCQTKEKEKQGRREKNALPSKYEHLALVFNGLNMYRELLRMRNSAETVENICACAQQLVKRDVRFEHLRKIETVRPGTFAFTKKKRDAIDQNHRQEGRTFIDPKSVRLEILEERTQRKCPEDEEEEEEEEEEEVKCNAEDNGVLKKREKSSHLMSEKERERARNADFHSRLMRLCDEAHLAFCQRHGIVISPSSNVPEQPLWHETFDVEREAPDIAECAVRDAPPLVPSAGGGSRIAATSAAAMMMTTMTTTTPVPTSMSIQSPKPRPSTPSSAFPLTPLNTTTTTKKKVVTERDIDEEIRRMQMDDGSIGEDEVSRQAIRRVLERKFEKEIHNSPSAVAHRAESKIKQNLPRIFDLVHSLFATSRKRAFAFDVLLHKTHEQINAKDVGGMFYSRDEIEDCLRTLAKTCSEWCKIERAQDGEELFRVLAGSFSSHSSSQPSSSSSSFAPFSGAGAARGRGRHLFGKTQYLPPPPSSSLRRSAPPPTSITTTTATTTMNERDVSSPSTKKRPFSSSSPIAKKVKQKLLMDAGLLGKIDGFGNNGLAAA